MRALSRCFIESLRICRFSSIRNYSVRVRFAPSPTGYLHLGGLRTALYNHLFCKKHGGKYILRVEDTDQTRLVEGATDHLVDILKWTGIEFHEGPHAGGNYGPYIQSERLDIYNAHCEQLLESKHAYRCFCTPERLELLRRHAASVRQVPKYDNRCRHYNDQEVAKKMAENKPYTCRFKLSSDPCNFDDLVYGPLQFQLNEGDPVIMKSDGYPTYHFANVVDDHLMGITHVLRGVEWRVSTPKHLMLYDAFRWKPPQFAHLPLLMNSDGKKLSKRQNDVMVDNYRSSGFFPEAVLNLVTNMGVGFDASEVSQMNIDKMAREFDLARLYTNSSQVGFHKMNSFNQFHLKKKLADEKLKAIFVRELKSLVISRYEKNLSDNESLEELSDDYAERVLLLVQNRITMLPDLVTDEYKFLWVKLKSAIKENKTSTQETQKVVHKDVVSCLIDILSSKAKQKMELNSSSSSQPPSHSFDTVDSMTCALKDLTELMPHIKYGQVMKMMRETLNGPKMGPSVAEMMTFLGRERTITRLKNFLIQ